MIGHKKMAKIEQHTEVKIIRPRDENTGKIGYVFSVFEGAGGMQWVKVLFDDFSKGLYEAADVEPQTFAAAVDECQNRGC